MVIAEALLAVHEVLLREVKGFEKRVRIMARDNAQARLLMTTTGVGAVVSLYLCVSDRRSRAVGQIIKDRRGASSG